MAGAFGCSRNVRGRWAVVAMFVDGNRRPDAGRSERPASAPGTAKRRRWGLDEKEKLGSAMGGPWATLDRRGLWVCRDGGNRQQGRLISRISPPPQRRDQPRGNLIVPERDRFLGAIA